MLAADAPGAAAPPLACGHPRYARRRRVSCLASTLDKEGFAMAFIRMFQPPNVTAEIYEAVNEKAGVAANPPEGLIFHCAGDAGGNWQILDVWESQEHARRFDEERLTPAIESVI